MREGSIELIEGGMYAGKTSELIKRVTAASDNDGLNVHVFKHLFDTRYSSNRIVSHDGQFYEASAYKDAHSIWVNLPLLVDDLDVVAIDEVQFFQADYIVALCAELAGMGIRVIVAGLDTDFRGEPFGGMPDLAKIADKITVLHAICAKCGGVASMTQRLVDGKPAKYDDPIVLVGASESYEARCRKCHEVVNK